MGYLSIALATGADGRWHPGIGDPTIMGWVTVVAYMVTAFLAFQALRRSRKEDNTVVGERADAAGQRRLMFIWGLTCVAMLLLGINKQLDLQTFVTETLRDMAIAEGWYENRRKYQVLAIFALGIGGCAAVALAAYWLRRVFRLAKGVLVGLALITSFVLIRAASFHRVDILLNQGAVRLNWVFELGAITVIAWACYVYWNPLGHRPDRHCHDS